MRRGSAAVSTGDNRNVATISTIVGSFKSVCSKMIRKINPSFAWQPRFYDHVIRKDESLLRIREYIRNNPANWDKDEENIDLLQNY